MKKPNEMSNSKQQLTINDIRNWLVSNIALKSGFEQKDIKTQEPFASYGLSSKNAIMLCGELEDWMGQQFSPTIFYEYPTIDILSTYLSDQTKEKIITQETISIPASERNPVAIIGIGCRFPGANNPEEFWDLLCKGIDVITEMPEGRWHAPFHDGNSSHHSEKLKPQPGGFLHQIDHFDPLFFGISPREANYMDPQQRMLLEVAYEALEDAGLPPDRLKGTNTGVFVGISNGDYAHLQVANPNFHNPFIVAGSAFSIAANRLSYSLDVNGPSMAIDTACSSSLVAIHMACKSLWNNESSLALAGGVNLILSPTIGINFSHAGFLSPDGHIKAFDAKANGYVRGEGVGVIVLKPLKQAIADGDAIYATILSSAVNHDGQTNGLHAPSRQAQEEVILKACRAGGISPGKIQYVETHGTGTPLGDPIEIKALGNVLAIDRAPGSICKIGSVKTNIGHLESAAGVAGVIKAALCLKNQAIPPSLHFRTPNPLIPFDELPLQVQQELERWPMNSDPRRSGVSSFGFGGTNAHAILEEFSNKDMPVNLYDDQKDQVFTISARNQQALHDTAKKYLKISQRSGKREKISLRDICYNTLFRRNHYQYRLSVVAGSFPELDKKIEHFLDGETDPSINYYNSSPGQLKIAFIFNGQGAEWVGMGQELIKQEPYFKAQVEKCDAFFRQYYDWSVLSELMADGTGSNLPLTEYAQPIAFTIQIALAKLLQEWGIKVETIIGHSMGEISAACIAGIITLEEAVKIIFHRAMFMKKTHGFGKMLAIAASVEAVHKIIENFKDKVVIAVVNSPTSVIISGESDAIVAITNTIKKEDILYRIIQENYAFHSPLMDSILDEFTQAIQDIRPQAPHINFVSTVKGRSKQSNKFDAAYWRENIRQPVFFSETVDLLIKTGHNYFIEIGPHATLANAIGKCLQLHNRQFPVISCMHRLKDDRHTLLNVVAGLHVHGYDIDWKKIYPTACGYVKLPSYAWQHKRYWIDEEDHSPLSHVMYSSNGQHSALINPLIHKRIQSPLAEEIFESHIGPNSPAFLKGHQIFGSPVFPISAFVEMVVTSLEETYGSTTFQIKNITIHQPLVFVEESPITLQLILRREESEDITIKVFSLNNKNNKQSLWQLHMTGKAVQISEQIQQPFIDIESRIAAYTEELSVPSFYRKIRKIGLEYAPVFQGINRLWIKENRVWARIKLPVELENEADKYSMHPVLLDACFQALAASIPDTGSTACYLPTDIGQLQLYSTIPSEFWTEVILKDHFDANEKTLHGEVHLYDDSGKLIAEVKDILLKRAGSELFPLSGKKNLDDLFYQVKWQPVIRDDSYTVPSNVEQAETWIIFSGTDELSASFEQHVKDLDIRCISVFEGKQYSKSKSGQSFIINPANVQDFKKLFSDIKRITSDPIRRIIHLWSLSGNNLAEITTASLKQAQFSGCGSILHLCQEIASWAVQNKYPVLHLVTRGSQFVHVNDSTVAAEQSMVWSMGDAISFELPELTCFKIDLDTKHADNEALNLIHEIRTEVGFDAIAFRNNSKYIPKLVRYKKSGYTKLNIPDNKAYCLGILSKGILDNLIIQEVKRQLPGPYEVEIEVFASGLNFRDVMNVMGLYPGDAGLLGYECAGKIVTTGRKVKDYKVGDEVIAIASGCFGNYVKTDANLVVPKPGNISFEEAATIPVAFLTAYFTLHHLAKITAGDKILIHSGTGGVGMAAIQLAQLTGAEVYSTAGSPEKRELLKSMGVTHVMHSRTLDYADEILMLTNQEGVDIVLNALPGDYIGKNLSALHSKGRFLEIGKLGIWNKEQIAEVAKDVAYFVTDMGEQFQSEPVLISSMFHTLMEHFKTGKLKPLPAQTFTLPDAVNAFQLMAQAKHIGKVVISTQIAEKSNHATGETTPIFQKENTYLVTGGLSGLGLAVAENMVHQGVRHLVLIGRRPPSNDTKGVLSQMEAAGCKILHVQIDISDKNALKNGFLEIERSMPPLKGIVHAAGVLADGSFLKQDWAHFSKPFASKVDGAWNLHELSLHMSLDFFVLFSSVASILGSYHQAGYAAANSFLNSFAHYRRSKGLAATSINWGPWSRIGMASTLDEQHKQRFSSMGIDTISPEQGVEALTQILIDKPAQVAVLPLRLPVLFTSQVMKDRNLLSELYSEIAQRSNADPEKQKHQVLLILKSVSPNEHEKIMIDFLTEQVTTVLKLDRSQSPKPNQTLFDLGMDSLMAVELKNRINDNLGISISPAMTFEYPTIAALAKYLRDLVQPLIASTLKTSVDSLEGISPDDNLTSVIANMSEVELDAMIALELNKNIPLSK